VTEKFQEVQDSAGNTVARIVDNPNQRPNDWPVWIELAEGYYVYEGKQACHDRSDAPRVKLGVK